MFAGYSPIVGFVPITLVTRIALIKLAGACCSATKARANSPDPDAALRMELEAFKKAQ